MVWHTTSNLLIILILTITLVSSFRIKSGNIDSDFDIGDGVIQLKRENNSQSNLISNLQLINSLSSEHTPSYLQFKYPAKTNSRTEYDTSSDSAKSVKIPMRDILSSGFTGVVNIGNPRQELYCIIDSGSSVMFVNSYYCEQDHWEKNPQYDPTKSTSAVIPDRKLLYYNLFFIFHNNLIYKRM